MSRTDCGLEEPRAADAQARDTKQIGLGAPAALPIDMRVVAVVAVVAALALAPSRAGAQPALTPPLQPDEGELVSESTATALAVGTTALGFAAIYAGADSKIDGVGQIGALLALIGPSAGHIYAGENGHAVKMSLLRAGGVTVMMIGLLTLVTAAVDMPCPAAGGCVRSQDDHGNTGQLLLLAGGVTYAVATAYDLFDAHRAARRTNERAQQRMWMLVPTAMASPFGVTAPAVALTGRF
jgi:hypothetical protein